MVLQVAKLEPFRWKVFQVLRVEGENDSNQTLRDVRDFEIEDEEFEQFCRKHEHLSCFVPESNKVMADSYLVLDEVSCPYRYLDMPTALLTLLEGPPFLVREKQEHHV